MAKVDLGQTRLSHVSESYTLPECTNQPRYDGTFCMKWKKKLFQWIVLSFKQSFLKGRRK